MALHTQAEFCKMLGITKDYLKPYKKRGKVVLTDGKYIDDVNPINKAFIQSRKQRKTEVSDVNIGLPVKETVKVEVQKVVGTIIRQENDDEIDEKSDSQAPTDLKNLTYDKLVSEEKVEKILKTREEREVTKLKKEKMLGESLPIEPIKQVVLLLSEAIFKSVEEEFESYVIMFGAQQGLTREETSKMRKDAMDRINTARVKAVEDAKKAVRKIRIDFSAKKGRGEK